MGMEVRKRGTGVHLLLARVSIFSKKSFSSKTKIVRKSPIIIENFDENFTIFDNVSKVVKFSSKFLRFRENFDENFSILRKYVRKN